MAVELPDATSQYQERCLAIAVSLAAQSRWVSAIIGATILGLGFVFLNTPDFASSGVAWLFLADCVMGAIGIALSMLLRFDAALFRQMATYDDERAGGAAVDALLARRRLKPLPPVVRPLDDRMAGAGRWARRQRFIMVLFLLIAALALLVNFA